MVVYLGIFFLCVVCFFIERSSKNKKTHIYIDCMLIGTLVIMVGTSDMFHISDMQIYQNIYNIVPSLDKFNFSTIHNIYGTFEMEKGFLFLISLLKTLKISFRGFFILHALFMLCSLYYGMNKYTPDFTIVLLMFLYKIFFYNLFISMRQSIAIGIFWIILHYIEEKKIIPYMIGCLIAIQFHFSAIILIPIYFIGYLKINRKKVIGYISVFLVLSILLSSEKLVGYIMKFIANPIIQRKISTYTDFGDSLGIFHTMEYFLIIIIVILFYDKIITNNPHGGMIMGMLLVLAPIVTVFRGFGAITRFKDYFTVFYGVLFGLSHKLKISNRFLIYTFCIILSLFGYMRYILLFGNGESLLPYKNIIFQYLGWGR